LPYIKSDDRKPIDKTVKKLSDQLSCAGDFNYAFTQLIHLHINKVGMRYQNLNDMIGMLECAKLELYRRVVSPYEDDKIRENGDVLVLNYLRDALDDMMR